MLVISSIAIGFALILLLKKTTAPIPMEEDYYAEADSGGGKFEDWELNRFEEVCRQLLITWGLVVKSYSHPSPKEVEFVAHNPKPIVGGEFIIYGLLAPQGEVVEANRVMALSDLVRSERASKGVFITTGYFSADTAHLLEGAPLELINAKKLKGLLTTHNLLHLISQPYEK